ncbi:MAG: hypothetical protein NVS4B11_20520 [Ktedonobacteraceae bacterium]
MNANEALHYNVDVYTVRRSRTDGKYPTKWTDLARKRGTLPSILDTGTNFSRKAAPHLASFIDVL